MFVCVCVCVCMCMYVCMYNSGATRFHFLIPLTETPFKRHAIGKMPASMVRSTKYLSMAHNMGQWQTAASSRSRFLRASILELRVKIQTGVTRAICRVLNPKNGMDDE